MHEEEGMEVVITTPLRFVSSSSIKQTKYTEPSSEFHLELRQAYLEEIWFK